MVLEPIRDARGQRNLAIQPTRTTESLNSSGDVARGIREALVRLTGRADVMTLTFAPVEMVIALSGSFREWRAWCPACGDNRSDAYDRLMWSLRDVKRCGQHGLQLVDRCGSCLRPHRPLHWLASATGCPHCGARLSAALRQEIGPDAASGAVENLLALAQAGTLPSREQMRAIFASAAEAAGGLRALHRSTGISASELSLLVRGLVRPQLSAVVLVLQKSHASLPSFTGVHFEGVWSPAHSGGRPSRTVPPAGASDAIRAALLSTDPPSIRMLSRGLSTTPGRLRLFFASDLDRLIERAALIRRERALLRGQSVRQTVAAAWHSLPPPNRTRRALEDRLERPGLLRAAAAREELNRLRRWAKCYQFDRVFMVEKSGHAAVRLPSVLDGGNEAGGSSALCKAPQMASP